MNTNQNGDFSLYFDGIADKEMLMYKAVIEMIQEDYDINSIKVSDITSRAGIGKGTAYEYFSSKEEIIVKALLYDTYRHIKNVENIMQMATSFKEKYYLLLDYLEENMPYTKGAGSLLKMFTGTYEVKEKFQGELEKFHVQVNCPLTYVEKLIDTFMEQGYNEGIYPQANITIRRSVFATQVTGYIYCILNQYYGGGTSREDARDFAYSSVVKLLNP